MKVPPVCGLKYFGIQNFKKNVFKQEKQSPNLPPKDTLSFSSNVKYIKKYNTLPDEIKKILSPKDAVDMFKDMEQVAKGTIKRNKIGQGNSSKVYENPWLKDYYLIVLSNAKTPTQIVYSKKPLGDAIWSDSENMNIQIIKKA